MWLNSHYPNNSTQIQSEQAFFIAYFSPKNHNSYLKWLDFFVILHTLLINIIDSFNKNDRLKWLKRYSLFLLLSQK